MRVTGSTAALLLPAVALACDSCYGPINTVEHVRRVKRMQPGASDASYGPTRPLEWGQLNVLHTSDTHGWLAGHIKEQNYGADFGDYISFAKHLKHQAGNMGVDLLLVDTGDLHDGTGLSDSTSPDGVLTSRIFQELDSYDLLTIGNHELYESEVAYQTFRNFSQHWGERYLTSNVQIYDEDTDAWEYIGHKYRYFTTDHGLRILAFGVLFDFKGNSNASKVIPAATMVQQDWFQEVLHDSSKPVDLFLLIGHNIARPTTKGSTFQTVLDAIRAVHADTPVQIFGGHSHIRDFAVIDNATTALESGRYCETVGWFAMSGFSRATTGSWQGIEPQPRGVPNPTRPATNSSSSPWRYARRYLDWNRYTFSYHAVGAANASEFDYHSGLRVTSEITDLRAQQRLGTVYGCVPAFYCQSCVPFGSNTSLYTVLSEAMGEVIVNASRADRARMVYSNTGSTRFDMFKGPFTYDDKFIVTPYDNAVLFLADVPYSKAKTLLDDLNAGTIAKRHLASMTESEILGRDVCVDPIVGFAKRDAHDTLDGHDHLHDRAETHSTTPYGVVRRQVSETSGYTTTDDFGTDGDDTVHESIPHYTLPNAFMGTGGFPADGSEPEVVDVIFDSYIESYVLGYLGYNETMVSHYISENFTMRDYFMVYVQKHWQTGIPDCS